MSFLLDNIRRIVLISAVFFALAIYFFSVVSMASPAGWGQLGKTYADTAVILLYVSLLATPLVKQFPNLPYGVVYIKARRALGISAFFFGLMHATVSFFKVIGGFNGLFELPQLALFAIAASTLALLILTLLASTSFDYMVRLLGPRWKILHRCVYLAGVLIIFHAVIMGELDFLYLPLGVFFVLEMLRFIRYLKQKWRIPSRIASQ